MLTLQQLVDIDAGLRLALGMPERSGPTDGARWTD